MEARIKSRFTPENLSEIAQRYRIDPAGLEELDGFESFIFEFHRGEEGYILRVSHDHRRPEAWIRGEVDWINYLVDGGIGAATAVHSEGGNLVEAVSDGQGGNFMATVFERAPGIPAWEFGWDDALYRSLGWTIGRMHRLTQEYLPADPLAFRPQWDDPAILLDPAWLPDSEAVARQKYADVVAWCRTLPQDGKQYGLIHFDAHAGNFFVDGTGSICLFDFDDCHYNWFANDIAIVLFYMVMSAKDPAGFTLQFLRQFISGYRLENRFEPEWMEMLPMFLKMREIDLYGIIHRSMDVDNLEDDWDIRYMTGRKEKIEGDVPYLDLDLAALAGLLTP